MNPYKFLFPQQMVFALAITGSDDYRFYNKSRALKQVTSNHRTINISGHQPVISVPKALKLIIFELL